MLYKIKLSLALVVPLSIIFMTLFSPVIVSADDDVVVAVTDSGTQVSCRPGKSNYIGVEQNKRGVYRPINPKMKRLRRALKRASSKRKKKLRRRIKAYRAHRKACKDISVNPDQVGASSPDPTVAPTATPANPTPTPSQQPQEVACFAQGIYQVCTPDTGFFGSPCSQFSVTGGGLGSTIDEAAIVALNDCETNLTTGIISGNIGGSASVFAPCQVINCGSD